MGTIRNKILMIITNPIFAIEFLLYRVLKTWKHYEYKKLIVLTRSRTGSNMLISFLNSHPSIYAEGEIFGRLNNRSIQDILLGIFSRYPRYIKAVGFKIFYYHPVDSNSRLVFDELTKIENLYVIHLKRRNILRTLASRKIAEKKDVWGVKDSTQRGDIKERKVHFTVDELQKGFEQTRQWEKTYGHMFESKFMIDIYYEDLVNMPEDEFRKITSLLGVRYFAPHTDYKKQNPEPLAHLIGNYVSLKEAFSNTEWSPFFED